MRSTRWPFGMAPLFPILVLAGLAALPAPAAAVDLVQTAANVVVTSGSVEHGVAGEALTGGQPLYKDPATNKMMRADNNDADANKAKVVGMALHSTAINQPISYQTDGLFNPGATVTVGATYVLSANVGAIAPIADLATGNRLTYLGYGETTSGIRLMIKPTGVTLP